ncbi:MAG TPA: 4-alpha-glucanotransferase [Chryseolinea sp.]|nr:4-alpha-glucanotransferase [Chryseolinea sp.]
MANYNVREVQARRKDSQQKFLRGAGILMHITSLPSHYGIGNLGPQAMKFIDFLSNSRQHYWQILPLNPTTASQGHSPYSSISSMAGNTLLISPEHLASDKLITLDRIGTEKSGDRVDFPRATVLNEKILNAAYKNFLGGRKFKDRFQKFIEREAYWLDDFALYAALKQFHQNKAWYSWPTAFKLRNERHLRQFASDNEELISYLKWQQFIFFEQWSLLKSYAGRRGVRMFGDLPFYISYDSADVWAHGEIFNLNKKNEMSCIAGVPPDYFNSKGQLWGMPTFNWDVLRKRNYDWWIQRIRKNMELFDLLRLDHFRAFASYWEVPGHETTAINGEWKKGPGQDFFSRVTKKLGDLPFVAEDLGDVDENVYHLRDKYEFPGMKILQFAFSERNGSSPYLPNNYTSNFIVYTGTHDNNTSRGCFKGLTTKERTFISNYMGKPIHERNVATELSRLAYASVATTAILPIQDVLGLDELSRMNIPASKKNNWLWRLQFKALGKRLEEQLSTWTTVYNR